MAINTTVRWGRTRIREDISKDYNIKLARLYASDRKRGLNTKLATDTNLRGEITAGHQPISLHQFNGTKKSTETVGYNISFASNLRTRKMRTMRQAIKRPIGMSVEVRKGKPKVVRSAFQIGKFGRAVFARGQYKPSSFEFRNKRATKSGPDMPIDVLNSTSVATMALTKRVQDKWEGPIQKKYEEELQRQLKRLLD